MSNHCNSHITILKEIPPYVSQGLVEQNLWLPAPFTLKLFARPVVLKRLPIVLVEDLYLRISAIPQV